jgi:hypothetical protein
LRMVGRHGEMASECVCRGEPNGRQHVRPASHVALTGGSIAVSIRATEAGTEKRGSTDHRSGRLALHAVACRTGGAAPCRAG